MKLSPFKKKNNKEKKAEEPKKDRPVEAGKNEIKGNAFSYKMIKSPHVSEKASNISALGQYIFRVFDDTNKIEIKKAIEKLYNVTVQKVNVIYVPSKERQVGRHKGEKKGYKKAIITLRKGQTIEVISK